MTLSRLLLSSPFVFTLVAGCTSSGERRPDNDEGPRPIAQIVEATNTPDPIGKLLADIDGQMRAWNNLVLTAQTAEDKRKARMLEDNLSAQTHKRREEIITQLESGPLSNRVIAASALGFTRDREALSPLLAALDDRHDEVVGNALLGLMLLGQADTPLESICDLVRTRPDDGVRRNASQCLASLVHAGARADCVQPAARQGLSDPDAGVRSQCVLILATLLDRTSLPALCDRLYDETPLVAVAAARALAYFGNASLEDKGTCARALAKAYTDSRGDLRTQLRRYLVVLAGSDHGNDAEEWAKWAMRLP